jgi:hypothetical protein
MTGLLISSDAHTQVRWCRANDGEDMMHKEAKRYAVVRSGDGYEVQDADAEGARVYFSDSRRAARKMSKQLNRTHGGNPPNPWRGGSGGETGPGGGG